MSERSAGDRGWFEGVAAGEHSASEAIVAGRAEVPEDWPAEAVASGFASSETDYFTQLHEAAIQAADEASRAREHADDQQLIHRIRAIDDVDRVSNELAERVSEWARSVDLEVDGRREAVVELADRTPQSPIEAEIVALAGTVASLQDQRVELVASVERVMHDIAPNLAALAGPLLGARLIALAGGLERLAKMSSSTVQVLGAEDALFAHLRGDAPSPKHGIIFVHEFVRGTAREERGSAARALAGKLAIAARIDHYAGDVRPELERELVDRIERIRGRSS